MAGILILTDGGSGTDGGEWKRVPGLEGNSKHAN